MSGTKKLANLLETVYQFLDANSSETVIISLKREGRDVGVDDKGFSKLLWEKFISPKVDRWYIAPTIPSLGEARGKIVLFRRFQRHEDAMAMGLDAESWRYNCDRDVHGCVCVQDFCEVLETENIEIKQSHIIAHLKRASVETVIVHGGSRSDPRVKTKDGLLYVNFLSASNFWKVGCWPDRIARRINPEVQRWLAVEMEAGRGTGVVVVDFVGEGGDWGIVRLVVGGNARLLGGA